MNGVNDTRIEKVAENSLLKLFARSGMIILAVIGVPLLGYVGNRALATIDQQGVKLIDVSTKLEVLTNTVTLSGGDRYRGEDARRDIALQKVINDGFDHRLNALERQTDNDRKRRP
jgi:hypothetical protein